MSSLSGNLRDAQVALTPNCGSGISVAGSRPRISPLVHEHVDVLGVKISAVDMSSAVNLAIESIEGRDPAYVCAASVHGVMEAQRDPGLLRIFNQAAINIPDGMPLTWVGWLQGFAQMDRVFGPDFMLQMCRISVARGYRHFLYGGKPGVAGELSERLQEDVPGPSNCRHIYSAVPKP